MKFRNLISPIAGDSGGTGQAALFSLVSVFGWKSRHSTGQRLSAQSGIGQLIRCLTSCVDMPDRSFPVGQFSGYETAGQIAK